MPPVFSLQKIQVASFVISFFSFIFSFYSPAEKQVSLPKLFYAMERRERTFKMALRSLMVCSIMSVLDTD